MRHFRYVTIAFTALIVPSSWAQDVSTLRGLTTVAPVVNVFPRLTQNVNDVRDCGLSDTSKLLNAAESVIQQSNLKLVEPSGAQARLLLIVSVTALRSESQSLAACHVVVEVNLTAPING